VNTGVFTQKHFLRIYMRFEPLIQADVGLERRHQDLGFRGGHVPKRSSHRRSAARVGLEQHTHEEFAELRVPLVQDKPFAKDLLFDTGFRHSDYSYAAAPSTITNTYKFEVQYAPIGDYRLRLSYDKAIRAPSVVELYNPQLVGGIQFGNDPCAPPITYSLIQCERTGVTAAQYNSGSVPQGAAGQLSELAGGNPDLKPEQAETYTVGLNFAPRQIPNFTGSIDYFHIACEGRDHDPAGCRDPVQLREYRESALLQPDRAFVQYRRLDGRQHRFWRVFHPDRRQHRCSVGEWRRCATQLPAGFAAGLW